MKSLAKLILPFLTLSSITLIDSKAQDFLPGIFKNYKRNTNKIVLNERWDTTLYKDLDKLKTDTIISLYITYDLNNDGVGDVLENFSTKSTGELNGREISIYPGLYMLNFSNEKNPLKYEIILDPFEDGWNKNEIICPEKENKDPLENKS